MRVCNLGSGSKGNVTYIETNDAKILVDCGLPITQIELRLKLIGVDPKTINAIFITHEHSDHILSLAQFVKKYNADVYVHKNNYEIIMSKQNLSANKVLCFGLKSFLYKDVIVTPFELSHDSVYCVGYSFEKSGQKISIATDTGYLPENAINCMLYSDIIYIESNHSEKMLLNNPNYPIYLKKRILSRFGHLSNVDCAKAIYELSKGGTKQFVLSHLSENNNTPQIALSDVKRKLLEYGVIVGSDIVLGVSSQDSIGTCFEIKSPVTTLNAGQI